MNTGVHNNKMVNIRSKYCCSSGV